MKAPTIKRLYDVDPQNGSVRLRKIHLEHVKLEKVSMHYYRIVYSEWRQEYLFDSRKIAIAHGITVLNDRINWAKKMIRRLKKL